jgi:hypothetical protein
LYVMGCEIVRQGIGVTEGIRWTCLYLMYTKLMKTQKYVVKISFVWIFLHTLLRSFVAWVEFENHWLRRTKPWNQRFVA